MLENTGKLSLWWLTVYVKTSILSLPNPTISKPHALRRLGWTGIKKTSNPSPPVVQRISKVEGWFPSHFLSNTDLSRPTPLTAVVHTDSFDMTEILLLSNSETNHAFVHNKIRRSAKEGSWPSLIRDSSGKNCKNGFQHGWNDSNNVVSSGWTLWLQKGWSARAAIEKITNGTATSLHWLNRRSSTCHGWFRLLISLSVLTRTLAPRTCAEGSKNVILSITRARITVWVWDWCLNNRFQE